MKKRKINHKKKKVLKTYSIVGKSLCALAGGVAGFIIAGPFAAGLGVLAGIVGGFLLEKGMMQNLF